MKHAFAMDSGHALQLPGGQTPNSVGPLEKAQELHFFRTGTSGLPQAVSQAQLFLCRGYISELEATGWVDRGQLIQVIILFTRPGITHGVAINLAWRTGMSFWIKA